VTVSPSIVTGPPREIDVVRVLAVHSGSPVHEVSIS
jgi:hypothetical protein